MLFDFLERKVFLIVPGIMVLSIDGTTKLVAHLIKCVRVKVLPDELEQEPLGDGGHGPHVELLLACNHHLGYEHTSQPRDNSSTIIWGTNTPTNLDTTVQPSSGVRTHRPT